MMTMDMAVTQLPSSYTDLVIKKSNLLLRANMFEAQSQFDEAAELFAESARLEGQLVKMAKKYGQPDTALVHMISEMSCWAAAGDTYRALTKGQQALSLSMLTSAQRAHIDDFLMQLNQRRQLWMASWHYQASVGTSLGAVVPS